MDNRLTDNKRTVKDYLVIFFKGVLLGLVSVGVPGLSASTVGIIVGIYFMMVESISGIFKDFKKSFIFLIVLITGYSLGAVGAAFSVTILFDKYTLITTMVVLGFIIGSLPDMVISLKNDFKRPSCWVIFALIVSSIVLYNLFSGGEMDGEFPLEPDLWFLLQMLLIGVVTSATFVVPGVDFAVVFLSIGLYRPFMNMITEIFSFSMEIYEATFIKNVEILTAYLIGYFVGMFLFSKLIKFLSHKYTAQTNFASFAFVAVAPYAVVKNCILDNANFYASVPDYIVGGILAVVAFGAIFAFNYMRSLRKKAAVLEETE